MNLLIFIRKTVASQDIMGGLGFRDKDRFIGLDKDGCARYDFYK